MDPIKNLLQLVVATQLIVIPPNSWAQKKVALNPTQRKIAEDQLIRSALQTIARQSAMVTSASDFEKLMLSGLRVEDRKIVMSNLSGIKEFPTFRVGANSLWVNVGSDKVELKVLGFGTHEYEFAGVKWTYEPSQKLAPQIEQLARQITLKNKTATWKSIFLPEAEAWGPLAAALGLALRAASKKVAEHFGTSSLMVITGTVGSFSEEIIAAGACLWSRWTGQTMKACEQAKKVREDALYANFPAFDAVAKQNDESLAKLLSNYEVENELCEFPDGKPGEYRGRLRQVEIKDGKKLPISNWFNIQVKTNEEGLPTDFIITKSGSAGDGSDSLIAHIVFDLTRMKPLSFRIANPAYDPTTDILGEPHLNLHPAMKLSPEQKIAIDNANKLVRVINASTNKCVTENVQKNQAAGIETVPSAEATIGTQ